MIHSRRELASLDCIHEGSNSLVFRQDTSQYGTVVIKLLKNDYPAPRQVTQFHNEYELTEGLDIPGIREAYELRGPLSNILIFAELLESLGAEDHERIQKIIGQFRTSAQNLVALLENLLAWARMQRSMVEYQPKSINLKHIIEWNMNLLRPTTAQKEIRFHNALQTDLQVFADLDMLNTVMR